MGSNASKEEPRVAVEQPREEEDEPDEWDKRIFSTGCAEENMKMTDCYYDKKDWRGCKDEMETFRRCWKAHGNDQRTATQDAHEAAKSKSTGPS